MVQTRSTSDTGQARGEVERTCTAVCPCTQENKTYIFMSTAIKIYIISLWLFSVVLPLTPNFVSLKQ